MKNLYIKTMGCQMNEYDSSKMFDVLEKSHNLVKTENEKNADVLLINTCSIREKAETKLFANLHIWKRYKEQNSNIIIGVGGCVASQEGEMILKQAPFVDLIFGPQTLHRLPQMLDNVLNNKEKINNIDISFPEIEKFDNLPKTKTNEVSAYVSIMEGCSKYCSFCVVPYTRGEEISRPVLDIMEEVNNLVKQGVKEIHLLGQNVNAYRGSFEEELVDLAFLIELIADIDEVQRIRFTTSHPVEFSDRLIESYSKNNKLVSHLHLPIQSGSDNILNKMKRGHTVLEYTAKIKKLRKIRPNISISSDFIIGFPEESDEDFNATIKLIKDINCDKSFSFIYSPRPGTPASIMQDDISIDVKKQRLQQTDAISKSMIGSIQEILVIGFSEKSGKMYGRSENMRNVHFIGNKNLKNQIVKVRITDGFNNSLVGVLI